MKSLRRGLWNNTIANPVAKVGNSTLVEIEIRGWALLDTNSKGKETIPPMARFMNPLIKAWVNPLMWSFLKSSLLTFLSMKEAQ